MKIVQYNMLSNEPKMIIVHCPKARQREAQKCKTAISV